MNILKLVMLSTNSLLHYLLQDAFERNNGRDVGVTIGYPKLVFMDKTIQYVNPDDEKNEEALFKNEMRASHVVHIWDFVANDIYQLDDRYKNERQELEPIKKWREWVPYTIGAYLQHLRLVSPEQLFF